MMLQRMPVVFRGAFSAATRRLQHGQMQSAVATSAASAADAAAAVSVVRREIKIAGSMGLLRQKLRCRHRPDPYRSGA